MDISTRYYNSVTQLARAERRIPLGAQTFSKSKTQYPVGNAPLYVSRAKGSQIWDIDGNRYLDLVSALGAVSLGYRNRRVDSAVRKQIRNGVTFSLSTVVEAEVAELLSELIPYAEMSRFAKNGSDVTSAAVRLARHVTGKERVVSCGYHGWHDWYIGTTSSDFGVPKSTSSLTKSFQLGDILGIKSFLETYGKETACIIIEPISNKIPDRNFILDLRLLCDKHGCLLIFDEVLCGFRTTKNGAGVYFGVEPDLACFGKAIANGYPLSALVGKSKYMSELQNVFFSGTFGGETLSLVAAKEVIKMTSEGLLVEKLAEIGGSLKENLQEIIGSLGISFLTLSGHPSWTFLDWNEELLGENTFKMKTLFLQEMCSAGVLILNAHNVTSAMTKRDLSSLYLKYQTVLTTLKKAYDNNNVSDFLRSKPIEPLFKVR